MNKRKLENISDRHMYLYGIMSEAEDRYIDEMLSDEYALEIKAANKRSRIRLHSAFAACAAALVLVIGLSAFPNKKAMNLSDGTAGNETIGTQGFDNVQEAAGEEPAAKDEEVYDKAAAEDYETDGLYTEETVAAEDFDTAEPEQNDNADANLDMPGNGMVDKNPASEKLIKTADGMSYRRVSRSSADHRGKFSAYSSDAAAVIYEFDNFPTDAIVLADIGGEYVLLINDNFHADDLEDIFRKFGFRYYLHCERISIDGAEAVGYDDAAFQSEAWGLLFDDPESMTLVDDADADADNSRQITYHCRLGTADETYTDIEITAISSGYVRISFAGQSFTFVNPNAGVLADMY